MSEPRQPTPQDGPPAQVPLEGLPPPTVPQSAPPVEPFPWRRLDPRMLLVHPVLELVKFFPFLVGIFVLGRSGEDNWWQFIGVGIPIALGVMRFLTTTYRVTQTQVELQRGLIGKKVVTARLDRVRAVELTSSPIHRLLGLAKIEIGTASGGKQDDDKFALDSLPMAEAREMRVALLHRTEAPASFQLVVGPPHSDDVSNGPSRADVVLVRLDPRWVRFAPLTSSGNVIAAGLLALFGQFADRANLDIVTEKQAEGLLTGISVVLVVVLVPLSFIILGAVFAILGYLISNWGFTLSRDARGLVFQVRRGLLTTTETSLERERVRGLEVGEQLGLRLAGAGRLSAVVTGISKDERSSTQLVPPAPIEVVAHVGAELLEDASPMRLTLQQHGPAARRRRYTRALLGASVVPVLALVLSLTTPLPWWAVLPALSTLPIGLALAADRYRRLGHGLTEGYLVVRSGTLRGRRDVLQRSGVIGWNVQQSWFQRRAGLVTLVATTAAGQQAYAAIDIPEGMAVALADAAVPGLLTPFLS
ncbi:MAG: PH domain-containing protein [Marmoricola sp.]